MSSWGWSLLSTGLANEKRVVQARAETSQLGLAAGLVPVSGADTPTRARAVQGNEHFTCSGKSWLPEAEIYRAGSAPRIVLVSLVCIP